MAMHHKISISPAILKPGMNWVPLETPIEMKAGDTAEISILPIEEPIELRALRVSNFVGALTGVVCNHPEEPKAQPDDGEEWPGEEAYYFDPEE